MISYQDGDYLVIEQLGKARLVKAVGSKLLLKDPDSVKYGDFDTDIHVEDEHVLANLGQRPANAGKVFGATIEPILAVRQVESYGDVYFTRRMNKEERKQVLSSIVRVSAAYRELGVFPDKPFNTFVLQPRTSGMAGLYKYHSTPEKPDELALFPESFADKKITDYYTAHELAHGLYFTRLLPEDKSLWVEAYDENIEKAKCGSNTLISIREGLKEIGQVSAYKRQADEREVQALGVILKRIARVHKLQPRHIDDLLKSGSSLKKIWPTDPIELSSKAVLVTDYANKSPEELFAEVMAYHMIGDKIPKTLKALLMDTLKAAKANSFDDVLAATRPSRAKDQTEAA